MADKFYLGIKFSGTFQQSGSLRISLGNSIQNKNYKLYHFKI
jgi:hypothetical protein